MSKTAMIEALVADDIDNIILAVRGGGKTSLLNMYPERFDNFYDAMEPEALGKEFKNRLGDRDDDFDLSPGEMAKRLVEDDVTSVLQMAADNDRRGLTNMLEDRFTTTYEAMDEDALTTYYGDRIGTALPVPGQA